MSDFSFNYPATTEIYTLSLHDALPISPPRSGSDCGAPVPGNDRQSHSGRAERYCRADWRAERSEEHTSELQSPDHLVCRLLLEKKKNLSQASRLNTHILPITTPPA